MSLVDHTVTHILLFMSQLNLKMRQTENGTHRVGDVVLDIIRFQRAARVHVEFMGATGVHLASEKDGSVSWHVLKAINLACEARMASRASGTFVLDENFSTWVKSRLDHTPKHERDKSRTVFKTVSWKAFVENASPSKIRKTIHIHSGVHRVARG